MVYWPIWGNLWQNAVYMTQRFPPFHSPTIHNKNSYLTLIDRHWDSLHGDININDPSSVFNSLIGAFVTENLKSFHPILHLFKDHFVYDF